MSEYAQRFAENGIDISVLPDLTDQDLKEEQRDGSARYRRACDCQRQLKQRERRGAIHTLRSGFPPIQKIDTMQVSSGFIRGIHETVFRAVPAG
jgi:hypothetical protein